MRALGAAPAGGWRVIEPSAGAGALVDPLLAHPDLGELHAVELDPADAAALDARDIPRLHVAHADALTLARGDAPPSSLGAAHGATPPARLDGAAARLREAGWADAVVANPPYLRETGNAATFRALRTWHDGAFAPLYRKDADLHHFFWDVAMRWLRPGGVLAMLTPAYVFDAEAAQPLRARLAQQGAILGLWRAGHARTFPGAGVEAAVTLWRKGAAAAPATRLDERLQPVPDVAAIPIGADGEPWRWHGEPDLQWPFRARRLGEMFRVVEGVSIGANRLRQRDVDRVVDGRVGEPITVFRGDELRRAGFRDGTHERFVRGRYRHGEAAPSEHMLLLRDGDLEGHDDPALLAHLERFRPVLEGRAEIRRNPTRSWYAAAWPRAEVAAPALVTPKWAKRPSFALLPADRVPMTDYRVLLPRDPSIDLDVWLRWLQGPTAERWMRATLKRKGELLECYGRALAELPGPPGG